MAKTRRDEVIDWLNDAYAMERGLEVTLRKQAQSKELHQAVRTRAGIHLDETIVHAERLCDCLAKLGSSPSPVKTIAGEASEMAKAYSTKFTADERVKDYLGWCSAEAFEVACYKSLIEAANEASEEEIVPLLEKNLAQDSAMAHWLEMNVGAITRDYLFHMPIGSEAA